MSYYEYEGREPEYERECKCCLEKEQTVDEASQYLEKIIKILYGREYLDKVALENCLDELCHLLQVKTIAGDLQVTRSSEEIKHIMPKLLNHWVEQNNEYLKQA